MKSWKQRHNKMYLWLNTFFSWYSDISNIQDKHISCRTVEFITQKLEFSFQERRQFIPKRYCPHCIKITFFSVLMYLKITVGSHVTLLNQIDVCCPLFAAVSALVCLNPNIFWRSGVKVYILNYDLLNNVLLFFPIKNTFKKDNFIPNRYWRERKRNGQKKWI